MGTRISFWATKIDAVIKNTSRSISDAIIRNKEIIIFVIFLVLFFQTYILWTYDGFIYFSYLDYFDGLKPFSEWDNVRGIVYPLYLWLSEKLFGASAEALNFSLFILYYLFIRYVLKIADFFIPKYTGWRIVCAKYIPCTLLFMNPFVYGYFHYILTEGALLTLFTITLYICLKENRSRYGGEQVSFKRTIWYYIKISLLCTVSYSLKQMYLTPPLFLFGIFEFIYTIKQFNKKKMGYFALGICMVFAFFFCHMAIFNSNTKGTYKLKNSIISVKQRYFNYDESQKEILVYNDDYSIKDIIKVKDDSNIWKIKGQMFKEYPGRFVKTYIDNYLTIAGVYGLDDTMSEYFNSYGTGPLNKDDIMANILHDVTYSNRCAETYWFTIIALRNLGVNWESTSQFDLVYDLIKEDEVYNVDRMNPYRKNFEKNRIRQLIVCDYSANVASIFYTIFMLAEFPIFMIFFIRCLLNKKTDTILFDISTCASSGAAFAHTMAMVLTGCIIDRYMMVSYVAMSISMFLICWKVIYAYNNRKKV